MCNDTTRIFYETCGHFTGCIDAICLSKPFNTKIEHRRCDTCRNNRHDAKITIQKIKSIIEQEFNKLQGKLEGVIDDKMEDAVVYHESKDGKEKQVDGSKEMVEILVKEFKDSMKSEVDESKKEIRMRVVKRAIDLC